MDNGHVIEGTSICINYWKKDNDRAYLRFLTHLNSDYSSGFGSDFQECIHTSSFNAWLITNRIGVNSKYIVSLSIDDSHILYDESTKKNFSVTVVDANHNAGSVMFIFQGDFGNILYTGYFRYNMDMLQHPVLKSIIETKTMDTVYFDNTYAAEHCVFPSKEEALQEIQSFLSRHPDHSIIFGIESYGKEELLFAAAKYLNEQICVSESKLQVLSQMGFAEMFTTDPENTRIKLMDIKDVKINTISHLKLQVGPVLTILPSALYHTVLPISSVPFHEAEDHNIHVVPYSSHSSHYELTEFINCVKPQSVIPIINMLYCKDLSRCLDRFWANIWKNYVVPSSIMFLSSSLESPLNLSPPDATVFDSESDDMVTKKFKSDSKFVSMSNNGFRKHLFFDNIRSGNDFNMNGKITLNSETVEYDYVSANNVTTHSRYEEPKNSIEKCGVGEDFVNVKNNFDCFDISVSSTDDESSEFSYISNVNNRCDKDRIGYNVLPHLEQNCESAWNNVERKYEKNIDTSLWSQVAEHCQHPLNNVKAKCVSSPDTNKDLLSQMAEWQNPLYNVKAKFVSRIHKNKSLLSQVAECCQHPSNNFKAKCVSSTSTDKSFLSQVAEHCQNPLNNVKFKYESSADADKELLHVAKHFQSTSDSTKSKCDKNTNTDNVSQKVKHDSLPSVGHCGKPEDLDVGLLIKVYEEEKRLSALYRYGYLDRRNVSKEVTKGVCTELNSKGSEKYIQNNGNVKETFIEKWSDSLPSSSSTGIYRQSLATPDISVNCSTGTHKRKLMDSILYNKCKLNKASISMCIYERNNDSGSCSLKKKKMILKSSY